MTATTDTTVPRPSAPISWDAPDGGLWSLENAHYGGVTSMPFRAEMEAAFAEGFRHSFAQLGVPLSHLEIRHVNGWPYVGFFLHNVPRSTGKPPPAFVLKAVTRIHPAFRKRTKIASAALADRRPARMADEWSAERDGWIARNLAFQQVDPDRLDDTELADHLAEVARAGQEAMRRHFELVTGCIPLGEWFTKCDEWGLEPRESRRAVMHSTPVHDEARRRLQRIAAALDGATPEDFEAIRAHSHEAAAALDDYLDHHGWWATEDALVATRLLDHPDVILASIDAHRHGAAAHQDDADELLAELRMQVPAGYRSDFDRSAHDAHRAHAMLDDNSGILGSWSVGIAGATVRTAARRLAASGRIESPDHIWGLELREIDALLRGRSALSPDDVARRVASWRALGELEPPLHLNGEPTPPPDVSVFPHPVAQLMTGIGAFLQDKFNDTHTTSGIGSRTVTGRAVVVDSPSEAFDRLEPGDILVTSSTTPAYDAVLPIVAGLVVSRGGPSCHAAIVARELDLPTIVGMREATTAIPDGATITLDPVAATVVVSS